MDDAVSLVCVQPVEASGLLAYPDARWQRNVVAILQKCEGCVKVRLDHLGLALDPVDGGTGDRRR